MEGASLPTCLQNARRRLAEFAQREAGSSTFGRDLKNPFGLIYFNIVPIDDAEKAIIDESSMEEGLTVYVHNYTGFFRKPAEEKIHQGKGPVPVKVWRIVDNVTGDWMEQEYAIIIVTKNYFGSGLIKVKPDKPVMNIEVKIRVDKKEKMFNRILTEKIVAPILLPKSISHPPVRGNILEEEVSRIKAYLAMLDSERSCGLISEKAYHRLRRRLESILFEILFGEGAEYDRIGVEEPVTQYLIR
ncbi:MAG: hypothetical protein QXR44_03775 [Thermoproteota archaeon]